MNMGIDMTALGNVASQGAEVPRSLGSQLEYLFAQQLLHALSAQEEKEGSEGSGYLALLSDPLAQQMADQGTLGIAAQLLPGGTP